ncbi:FimD/PapC C-terminal domain-containing protein [Providencia hangzhouensis]|uniref:FimD/PapC C-terminal domain-containing protein n=1 Tax=Providencia hangzhouensis TaxID=3031799 RepID=UPI0034DCC8A2
MLRLNLVLKSKKIFRFYVVRPGNKPLPFGANVTDINGESIGIVGQGGTVFINSETANVAIIKWDNGSVHFL